MHGDVLIYIYLDGDLRPPTRACRDASPMRCFHDLASAGNVITMW